jgi:hypothetical protein
MSKDTQNIDPSVLIENIFGFYARDQWQVSRKLTVTYGLRYEIYPFAHSNNGLGGLSYSPSTNLVYLGGIGGTPYNASVKAGDGIWAPRLGVAYRLNDKTVIRTGFGINPNAENFRGNVQVYPEVISNQYSGANSYSAAGSLVTGLPPFVSPNLSSGALPLPTNVGTATYPTNYNRGYTENYNFFVQRDLGKGFTLQAGFVGTHALRVNTSVNINAAAPGTGKAGQPLYLEWGNASTISYAAPFDSTRYNSLQTTLSRRMGHALFTASYTLSRVTDYADNDEAGLTWNWAPVYYRNYALAGFDRTHNFELSSTYELPFGKSQRFLNHGVAAAIVGGWQLNGILSCMSGNPFTVSSSATSLNAPGNSQTANQVVANVQILGGHGPNSPYFDPNAFLPVTTATFGNSGRDILFGPGFFNLDASLYRTFTIRERFKLQFRAEAFGLTNTPQFANPSATVSNATFANGVATNLNGYDVITSSTGERQLRFALKLTF